MENYKNKTGIVNINRLNEKVEEKFHPISPIKKLTKSEFLKQLRRVYPEYKNKFDHGEE